MKRHARMQHRAVAGKSRGFDGGFTLVEVMFGCAIGSIIALVALGGLVEGMQLFRSNSSEMVARDKGSEAIRRISTDMQAAQQIQIYSNYSSISSGAGTYGSCGVVENTSGGYSAYYLYTPTSDPNSGGLYYCANSSAAGEPNPAKDILLVSNVQDFEFRSDVSGTVRAGFKIGVYGWPTLSLGSYEYDLVRFSTSNLPRN